MLYVCLINPSLLYLNVYRLFCIFFTLEIVCDPFVFVHVFILSYLCLFSAHFIFHFLLPACLIFISSLTDYLSPP